VSAADLPEVVEGEAFPVDDLIPRELQFPPVTVGPTFVELVEAGCVCGNATDRGHGAIDGRPGFTCDEIITMRNRHAFACLSPWQRLRARLRGQEPEGWRR
jgi:hypothetical protein